MSKLTINERLKLFGQVCAAVAYAHQNAWCIATSSRAISW
jgi:hypothetical protein